MARAVLWGMLALVLLYAIKFRVWNWWFPFWSWAIGDGLPFVALPSLLALIGLFVVVLDKRLALPALALVLFTQFAPVAEAAPSEWPGLPPKGVPSVNFTTPTPDPNRSHWGFSPYGRTGAINIDYAKQGAIYLADRIPRPYEPIFTVRDDWFTDHANIIFPPNPDPFD